MTTAGAEKLLKNLCAIPDLTPDFWNISEPIDKPFELSDLDAVIRESMIPSEKAREHFMRTLAFFVRVKKPRYQLTIDLRLAPVQWRSAHNCISIHFVEPWPCGEMKLARYLVSSVLPEYPDYVKIVESSQEDPERLKEFHRTFTANEFRESIAKRAVALPFGPYGCIEDIYWFNYFGSAYVDFIGLERLAAAKWARVEKIGGGLACYASSEINVPTARQQRSHIASQLEEFLWTPGCKRESKRIPIFDFSEQEQACRNLNATRQP